jgi:nucleoside-triphosphatase
MLNPKIIVITGGRGAGKTTLCRKRIEAARFAGEDIGGIISPARFNGGEKTGIWAEKLRTGERRLLASLATGELSGHSLGPWTFDLQALEWGNQVIVTAPPCDLLVIDELGPLEFNQNMGWNATFEVLRCQNYKLALVVIRPECIEAFAKMRFVFQIEEV